MRALIQRVLSSSVCVDGELIGKSGRGLLIFLGITHDDSMAELTFLVKKCAHLRIFEDENGKMNKSLLDVSGEALVVSQFTLYGDCRKGRRPSFIEAARPDQAIPLYNRFITELNALGIHTESGGFGADMQVELVNDGPVTLMLESSQ